MASEGLAGDAERRNRFPERPHWVQDHALGYGSIAHTGLGVTAAAVPVATNGNHANGADTSYAAAVKERLLVMTERERVRSEKEKGSLAGRGCMGRVATVL